MPTRLAWSPARPTTRDSPSPARPGATSRSWAVVPAALPLVDRWSRRGPVATAKVSPLTGRILVDGSYLRAALGSTWAVLPVLGVVLGCPGRRAAHLVATRAGAGDRRHGAGHSRCRVGSGGGAGIPGRDPVARAGDGCQRAATRPRRHVLVGARAAGRGCFTAVHEVRRHRCRRHLRPGRRLRHRRRHIGLAGGDDRAVVAGPGRARPADQRRSGSVRLCGRGCRRAADGTRNADRPRLPGTPGLVRPGELPESSRVQQVVGLLVAVALFLFVTWPFLGEPGSGGRRRS